MTKGMLFLILNNIYNNTYVVDKNMTCIYANSRCTMNYGLLPEQMIGKSHDTLWEDSWYPSGYPLIRKYKRLITIEHVTKTGNRNICFSTPVLNDEKEINMYISVNQEKFNEFDGIYDANHKEIEFFEKRNQSEYQKDVISSSPVFCRLLDVVEKVSNHDIPILIQGETGTGKTMLARHIHEISKRKEMPFLSLNCAAIPASLLESELFGYAPHAFTGADKNGKKGLLELADGGTLFLDEIGDMDLSVQAKLLSAIESKSFIPLGGKSTKTIDVRILSATNRNLQELILEKQFREDLYWRLCVINLYLPPLRERKEDIESLAKLFLYEYNQEYEMKKYYNPKVLDFFNRFSWPGNIRQLKNVVEIMAFMSSKDELELEDIPEDLQTMMPKIVSYHSLMEMWEKDIVCEAYLEYKSVRKVASHLKISTSMAQRLIQKYVKTNNSI